MGKVIPDIERGVIPACDVSQDKLDDILRGTKDVEKISAYKIGFKRMLEEGLPDMEIVPGTLYNHCCTGTDIPDTGKKMMEALKTRDEIAGVILTPLAGPETERTWIEAAHDVGLDVYVEPIVQGARQLDSTFRTIDVGGIEARGYIADEAVQEMVNIGLEMGVKGIILPDVDDAHVPRETDLFLRDENGLIYSSIIELNPDSKQIPELEAFDVMEVGLPNVVRQIRSIAPDKKIIYDHQKAGMGSPRDANRFAGACFEADVDAAILFPQASPYAQVQWTKALQDRGIGVIVGGVMTHPAYLRNEENSRGERGFINAWAAKGVYSIAAQMGVEDFVVPGNKIDSIKAIRDRLEAQGVHNHTFYSPGLVKKGQGGDINKAAEACGKSFHGIVGRGIYLNETVDEIRAAALELTSQI